MLTYKTSAASGEEIGFVFTLGQCNKISVFSLSLISECVIVVDIAEKKVTSAQIKEHRGAVLDLIEMYLKGEFMQLITVQTELVLYQVLRGLFSMHPFVYLKDVYWLRKG